MTQNHKFLFTYWRNRSEIGSMYESDPSLGCHGQNSLQADHRGPPLYLNSGDRPVNPSGKRATETSARSSDSLSRVITLAEEKRRSRAPSARRENLLPTTRLYHSPGLSKYCE